MKKFSFYIASMNTIGASDELQRVLADLQVLFDGQPRKYKFEKIQLKIMEGAKPIFVKPRPVPFSFKDQVSKQLEDWEAQGVIMLVEDNPSGIPLVPVLKDNGAIRVCADYQTTLNKVLQDVKHPLPRIEELFAVLSGGHRFSKLDLTAAYNQLEVTEETGRLLL